MRLPLFSSLVLLTACLHDRVEPEIHTTVVKDTEVRWSAPEGSEGLGTLYGSPVTAADRDGWVERIGSGGPMQHLKAAARPTGASRGAGPMLDADFLSAGEPMPSAPPVPAEMASADIGGPGGGIALQQPALRAGSTDDNVAFGEFLEFLDTWKDRPGVAGNHVKVPVADRTFLRVEDPAGNPVPGAHVTVMTAAEEVLWSGSTYGDGVTTFYPEQAGASGDLLVQAESGGVWTTVAWDGRGESVSLTLDAARPDPAVDLDVVFVIDTTGSMSDEIARIKSTLLSVTAQVRGLDRAVDLRYGAVLYRDLGDAYLTRHTPLTHDVKAFDALLQTIEASGGGDGPESLNQGLAVAVESMEWRDDAAKLMFLVADAPPHMDYEQDVPYADSAKRALARGIRVHTVAASGLDDFGSLVFRQTAQLTRGDFVFIEYGSAAASAADHGVTGPVANNNLDAILFRKIEREVNGWGVSTDRVASR
ncbi:MAG: VWA domain-containing protein [Myxococcales bacterium]|nr:VWA domain-containing protein [Myxococcales bacterium]